MSWPGSTLPPNAPRPRRRRAKGGKRRNGPTSTERLMVATARKLGIAPKAKATTEAIGRCLSHAFEELGFSSPWDLALYLDELARRRPGAKGKGNVRLPPEKRPPGVRLVIGVRCTRCAGRGCGRCEMHGWGVVYRAAIKKRAAKCKHETVPVTPATGGASTPPVSPVT